MYDEIGSDALASGGSDCTVPGLDVLDPIAQYEMNASLCNFLGDRLPPTDGVYWIHEQFM